MAKLPPILFEDDVLLAFDKPSGLLVAPDRWDKDRENLMDQVHSHLSPEIFNVHRLDFETSGVLLCSKEKRSHDFLTGEFQERRVKKRYLAITRGAPPEDEMTIDRPLSEDPRQVGRMRSNRSGGKAAETQLKVLTRWRGYALVELFPITGRMHQIRVHLTSIRSPVVADPMYGDGKPLMLSDIKRGYKHKEKEEERPLLGRLGLHAESLTIRHPITREPLTITSPLPKPFEVSIKYLKRFAGL